MIGVVVWQHLEGHSFPIPDGGNTELGGSVAWLRNIRSLLVPYSSSSLDILVVCPNHSLPNLDIMTNCGLVKPERKEGIRICRVKAEETANKYRALSWQPDLRHSGKHSFNWKSPSVVLNLKMKMSSNRHRSFHIGNSVRGLKIQYFFQEKIPVWSCCGNWFSALTMGWRESWKCLSHYSR